MQHVYVPMTGEVIGRCYRCAAIAYLARLESWGRRLLLCRPCVGVCQIYDRGSYAVLPTPVAGDWRARGSA